MVYPPGQGKSGAYLMRLWRDYLELYAESEGDVKQQTIVGSYHAAEVFGSLSVVFDRDGRYRELIDQRMGLFREGKRRAGDFDERLINATFSIYNHLNTLSRQLTGGHAAAAELIDQIDHQVHIRTQTDDLFERSVLALQASFPLLSLITLALSRKDEMTKAVRQVEQRFVSASGAATTSWERLINALYRSVEMMQLFSVLADGDLRNQVDQIASRFQEEDRTDDVYFKMRNGFCRLFELGHLVATHLDA